MKFLKSFTYLNIAFCELKNDTKNFKEKESSNDIPTLGWDVLFTSTMVGNTYL